MHIHAVLCPAPAHSKRLAKMISTMRERLSAKMGNNNDNAFNMRKLFRMYDAQDTGKVRSRTRSSRWPPTQCWVLHLQDIPCRAPTVLSLLLLQIHFEDFRMCSESFGMQLDDDSLLALYHVYDPAGR